MVVAELAPLDVMEESEFLTLAEAAQEAGYSSTSSLQRAARLGRLKTVRGEPPYLTTRAWLQEYLASVQAEKGRRGRPRSGGHEGQGDAQPG